MVYFNRILTINGKLMGFWWILMVSVCSSVGLRLGTRKTGLSPPPQYFYTDRSEAVLLLWILTVTCSCFLYLYFGSAIILVIYFVNFR